MNLMIVPEMFVCSSFLISVCMFIVSKALLISSLCVLSALYLDCQYLVNCLMKVRVADNNNNIQYLYVALYYYTLKRLINPI